MKIGYPGFTKALADFAADPRCRACGEPVDAPNSLTGVMCTGCFYLWYDGDLTDEERRSPELLGAASRLRRAEGRWPFDGSCALK